jgi:tetratricopeptide (TPR) repeat protein
MNEPVTAEEVLALHKLLRSDPQKYLALANERIARDPEDAQGYFDRHMVWMRLSEPERALEDLVKSIELDPKPVDFRCRGNVYRHIGEYEKALADYARGEAMDPDQWAEDAFPLAFQADTYARLGDEATALAYCARLPDDFWTPGFDDLPPGGKTEIAAELRRRAAAVRQVRT